MGGLVFVCEVPSARMCQSENEIAREFRSRIPHVCVCVCVCVCALTHTHTHTHAGPVSNTTVTGNVTNTGNSTNTTDISELSGYGPPIRLLWSRDHALLRKWNQIGF